MSNKVVIQQLSRHIVRALAYRIALKEHHLEKRLDKFFPLETEKLGLTLRLEHPKVRLNESENRIHLMTDLIIGLPGNIWTSGHLELAGTLLYAATEGAFYIDNPEIRQFSVLSIPPRYLTPAKLLVSTILSRYVSDTPVYKFRENSLKHRLAKSVFKTVEVHNGKLKVRFALG